MRTDDLIRALAANHRPIGGDIRRKTALAFGGALAAALVLYGIVLAPRPDLGAALATPRFAAKLAIMVLLAIPAAALVQRLARPGAQAGGAAAAVAVPVIALAIAVGVELTVLDPSRWIPHLVGQNAVACLVSIPLLAAPVLAAALYGLQHGAPTRPRLAGLAAGLLAGSVGAVLYGTHCPDDSPLFVATWYTIAIAAVALCGAWLGPRILRW